MGFLNQIISYPVYLLVSVGIWIFGMGTLLGVFIGAKVKEKA